MPLSWHDPAGSLIQVQEGRKSPSSSYNVNKKLLGTPYHSEEEANSRSSCCWQNQVYFDDINNNDNNQNHNINKGSNGGSYNYDKMILIMTNKDIINDVTNSSVCNSNNENDISRDIKTQTKTFEHHR